MADEGRVAILIIRAHHAEVTPDETGWPWARVTGPTDLDALQNEVVRPAGSGAGVHRLAGERLDAAGIPDDGDPRTGPFP